MDPTIRLRIATRIHFALLRHYDENIAVDTLLKNEGDAREALWVCEASGDLELVTLAKRFKAMARTEISAVATRQAPPPAAGSTAQGATPQDLAWTKDTSGFGVTRPPEAGDEHLPKSSSWLIPARWLRSAGAR